MIAIIRFFSAFCLATASIAMPTTANAQMPLSMAEVAKACIDASRKPRPAIAQSIVEAATQEWERFGARDWRDGSPAFPYRAVEADWVELKDAKYDRVESAFTWGRVLFYWRATRTANVLGVAHRIRTQANGLPERDNEKQPRRDTIPLDDILYSIKNATLADSQKEALRIAAIRASLIEQPWSAVFISSMMRIAGLDSASFPQAASHSDYMRAALRRSQTGRGGMRYVACPAASDLEIRPGDLICNGRAGTAGGFETLWNAPASFTSHCDIVIVANRTAEGLQIQSIGGNVQDTVLRTTYATPGMKSLTTAAPRKQWISVLVLR